jgi:hypothetical protein
MDVRITKLRVAMAALFVLAGVGLASLLSPFVGSALATVGTVANISDHSASAYFAKVDSNGKLAVGDGSGPLNVEGTVNSRPAPPPTPFRYSAFLSNDTLIHAITPTTSATIAFTSIRFANHIYNSDPHTIVLLQRGGPSCDGSGGSKYLGYYTLGVNETLIDAPPTPVVLKPFSTGGVWCLAAIATPAGNTSPQSLDATTTGYVVSGTFSGA